MDFAKGYKLLNMAQRQAVDTIDGPVLVVAGPGTGKTQLLSMRAANIVRTTDAAPNNILCLTFTESAAAAMRKRLIALMGPEGNNVAVHTFHSFGSDIINRYREYFYNGATFEPADELTSFEALQEIFEALPHSSPLAKTMNGEFTSLRDAQNAISHLKRAGLLPDELLQILDHNEAFCDSVEPKFTMLFAGRFAKKDLPRFAALAEQLADVTIEPLQVANTKPLAALCIHEFTAAVAAAEDTGKTTPLTAWRNKWLEKSQAGDFVFKDRKRAKKLRALAKVYQKYLTELQEQQLFDFDDMVSLVAHTLESTPELRFNLQEQYLYIMVDEFQDTNGAQLRLLGALTDNPVNEGRPNILAVGDDDQAIYSFQGAELSNILDFAARYRNTAVITLTDNYRSTAPILQHSRDVITLGAERLETTLQNVSKQLTAHKDAPSTTELHQFTDPQSEYNWIANAITERIKNGEPASEIAVLARNHKHLVALVPHLHAAGIAINYERRSDVLKSQHIREIMTIAHVIVHLADQRLDLAEGHLPEMLSYEFWGLSAQQIWQLSLEAYKQRRFWLEIMLESEGKLRQIAEFVIVASHYSQHQSLDAMLDLIIGSTELQAPDDTTDASPLLPANAPREEDFVSPYRAHYFNQHRLTNNPAEYLELLSNVRALRRALQSWHNDEETPMLAALLDFVELHERTNTPVLDAAPTTEAEQGVTLMTAHKAKGLEFNTVFVLSCQDEIWGRKARHPYSSLSFPHNLPIEPAGAGYDDALRLFFVAMTRAKQHLLLTQHATNDAGKEMLPAEFLANSQLVLVEHSQKTKPPVEQLASGWEEKHRVLAGQKQNTLLAPTLESYRISATHVNNFIDVTRGGPQAFLLQNLLRFPQSMTPSQAFGKAIHAALQRAHTHLAATGERRPVEDILRDFELQLHQSRLSERDYAHMLEKGSDVLQNYLAHRYNTFTTTQKAERNFAGQHVMLGDVRLTGAIDLMDIDPTSKIITVTDYKTGKGTSSWHGATDYEKIKLHKYKQQLMFYKLLIENSRDYHGYTVERGVLEFIEADGNKTLHHLTLPINNDELHDFTQLLTAIWRRIQSLDFPDTSSYEPSYNGILRFEQDILKSGDYRLKTSSAFRQPSE